MKKREKQKDSAELSSITTVIEVLYRNINLFSSVIINICMVKININS